ncbi:2-dehydro-3-deoxygalactonokinase [Caproiciproducens sp. NJN-50]|uniref:2-dehydro-3-deoxygalactonokinase n=2 Tax=Acutalibacteraceae TaxID=3082771 RepID=UPI001FAA1521|nr:2-dehydro-3-deoxygalactonokinase [Caproiciproducens sp. NJN-50]
MKYFFTIDTGTTNTRVVLFTSEYQTVGSKKVEAGVRDTAIDGNNLKIKAAVKDCLENLLRENGLTYDDIERVIASGMITSNVGLLEIPHLVVPVGLQDLAEKTKAVLLDDVCPLPIYFIPGVKNSAGPIDLRNFEAMDIMRGEEVESIAVLSRFPAQKDYLLVLPGSHTKFVSINSDGKITGCLTSINGEILDAITRHTIIADAVGREFVRPGQYDRGMVLLGFATAQKSGIGRACFSGRILNQFVLSDKQKVANYILGVALQSDITAVKNSDALKVSHETDVIVAGSGVLETAMADILNKDGYFAQVQSFRPEGDLPLSAMGCHIVAQKCNLL